MAQLLGLIILSFALTAILLVPFIDFLYKIKLQREDQKTKDPFNMPAKFFDKFHGWKVGTPFGGGILIIFIVTILTLWPYGMLNITDGLDGLASGLFLICLVAFLAITAHQLDASLGIFIAVLMGSVGAFLYFNIYKARIWLGDVGSLSLGAVLAVVGLLTGKIPALVIIGGVFILEVGSSLIQLLSKKFLKRKILPVSPLHLYLQKRGWEEPKIVMRAWLLGFIFAVVGLYIAFIR